MNDVRVLVTGASGFVGQNLLKTLVASNCEIMVIARCNHVNIPASKIIEADLSNPDAYREEVKRFQPDVVIHLAWSGLPDYSLEKSLKSLEYSLNFFSFIMEIGSCKKILVSGSCLEYGEVIGACVETDQTVATNHFAWAKSSLYSWLRFNCASLDITLGWFRIFYVYGPGQREKALLPYLISEISLGKVPNVRSPMVENDFIYIDDVTRAFQLALQVAFESGIYNIGSGSALKVIDFCKITEKILSNSQNITDQIELNRFSKKSVGFWADITKAQRAFGWRPNVTVSQGVRLTCHTLDLKIA